MWKRNPKHEDKPVESFYPETSHIGESIVIKGEISGSGNVHVAGEVEGRVELLDGSLTVEPGGHVHGDVEARSIVVHGRVEGDLFGSKSVDLKGSAVFAGDIHTSRLDMEEGVSLIKGMQVQKAIPAREKKGWVGLMPLGFTSLISIISGDCRKVTILRLQNVARRFLEDRSSGSP